ncbi:MAG: DUF5698 domain-containing protein [Gemmatimonadota bacterium]|nr:DUF5698 domain-containing protein [Gemmatimonadota bacterium]
MDTFAAVPTWLLGLAIFALRIVDVPIGTIRTISMVQGRARLAVTLGFFEVLIWVVAVSQVVMRIGDSFLLAVFYAAGFSAGTAVGMLVERRVSLGRYLIRIFTTRRAAEVSAAVHPHGRVLAAFPGTTPEGPVSLLFVAALGRRLPALLAAAQAADADMDYTVEPAAGWSERVQPGAGGLGWRSEVKRR